jgi:hypothetical protein
MLDDEFGKEQRFTYPEQPLRVIIELSAELLERRKEDLASLWAIYCLTYDGPPLASTGEMVTPLPEVGAFLHIQDEDRQKAHGVLLGAFEYLVTHLPGSLQSVTTQLLVEGQARYQRELNFFPPEAGEMKEIVQQFIKGQMGHSRSRLGLSGAGAPKKLKADKAEVLARSAVLRERYQMVKRYHDISYEQFVHSTHRSNREAWKKKWTEISRDMYPDLPAELVGLFAEEGKPSVMTITRKHLANEFDIRESYTEKVLTAARKGKKDSTKGTKSRRNNIQKKQAAKPDKINKK